MTRHVSNIAIAAAAATLGFAAAAQAQIDAPAYSWISVTGEIVSIDDNEFRLDYGQDVVTVESAGFGTRSGSEEQKARVGDVVTVNGYVDGGFFDEKSIEAASILNRESGEVETGMSDPERPFDMGFASAAGTARGETGADASFSGQVTDIEGREFTLVTGGGRELRVHTGEMDSNPLDTVGTMRVAEGDRVSVTGELDPEVFEDAEFVAQDIKVLLDMDKPGPE
ncbi:MAG: hypothetical protein R6V44_03840 [Paracoccaceae bacterium]